VISANDERQYARCCLDAIWYFGSLVHHENQLRISSALNSPCSASLSCATNSLDKSNGSARLLPTPSRGQRFAMVWLSRYIRSSRAEAFNEPV
jgi:hypothetical protein